MFCRFTEGPPTSLPAVDRYGYCCWMEGGESGRVLMKKQFSDYLRRGGQKDFLRGPCTNRSHSTG